MAPGWTMGGGARWRRWSAGQPPYFSFIYLGHLTAVFKHAFLVFLIGFEFYDFKQLSVDVLETPVAAKGGTTSY